jgi:TRAP-type C4-dicarboxylate transport system permease small subunit
MPSLDFWFGRLLGVIGVGVGLIFGALTLLISADVVGRNLGLGNLAWATEASEYLMYLAAFMGAPWLLRLGGHIRMDLVCLVLPRRGRVAAEVLCDLLGLAVCGVMFWYGLAAARDAFESGAMIIKMMVLPEWWIMAVVPASAALLIAEFVLRLARVLRPVPLGDQP